MASYRIDVRFFAVKIGNRQLLHVLCAWIRRSSGSDWKAYRTPDSADNFYTAALGMYICAFSCGTSSSISSEFLQLQGIALNFWFSKPAKIKSNYAQLLCKCLFLNAPFVWEFCPFVYREMSIFRMISNFKKPISATFSPISPCLSAPALFPFQGASFAHDIPLKIPSFPLFIHSFRGILCSRISKQNLRGDFRAKHCTFSKIPYFLVQISACPGVRVGRFSGDGLG